MYASHSLEFLLLTQRGPWLPIADAEPSCGLQLVPYCKQLIMDKTFADLQTHKSFFWCRNVAMHKMLHYLSVKLAKMERPNITQWTITTQWFDCKRCCKPNLQFSWITQMAWISVVVYAVGMDISQPLGYFVYCVVVPQSKVQLGRNSR